LQLLVSLAATVKSEALAVNGINSAVNGVEKNTLPVNGASFSFG